MEEIYIDEILNDDEYGEFESDENDRCDEILNDDEYDAEIGSDENDRCDEILNDDEYDDEIGTLNSILVENLYEQHEK